MTLREAIARLDDFDAGATLYVEGRPDGWTAESDTGVGVALILEDEETGDVTETLPSEAEGRTYFLEVDVARDVLSGWEAHLDDRPSPAERVERIIYYARFDA
jgi:hypothetical protein